MINPLSIRVLLGRAIGKAAAGEPRRLPETVLRKDLGRAPYASDAEFGKSAADANRYQNDTFDNPSYPRWSFYAQPLKYFTDKRPVKVTPTGELPNNAYMQVRDPSGNAELSVSPTAHFDYLARPDRFNALAGHEGLHTVQYLPETPSTLPARLYDSISKASPNDGSSKADHRIAMATEAEAALQQYKPQMYKAGVDPYGPRAAKFLIDAIKARQRSNDAGYLQHTDAKTLQDNLPLLLHILRGVAKTNGNAYQGYA